MSNELTYADPGPLGLAAFGLSFFALSMINAGIFPASVTGVIVPIALFYGGVAEVIVGWIAFKLNNLFAATAFTSYGMLWISLGTTIYLELNHVLNFGGDAGVALGLYLISWTIFTIYIWIASFKTTRLLTVLFTLLLLDLIALSIGAFGHPLFTTLGGWGGLVTALLAWYISAAAVINSTFGRTVLRG
jgi:succinate-acetate transporter protein